MGEKPTGGVKPRMASPKTPLQLSGKKKNEGGECHLALTHLSGVFTSPKMG